MPPIRVVFMGTPDLARTVLAALASSGDFDVTAVVAQADKPTGRGLQLTHPPVKVEATSRGLAVMQPVRARDPGFLKALRELAPDVIVVAAYGQILPQELLDIPRHGCVNVHTSLLPRWRGAAPIQWALAAGDAETGVTLMRMEAGLDTGPTFAEVRTPIVPAETGQTLHDRLAALGAALLCEALPRYVAGALPLRTQPSEGVTYARKITREDGRLDWNQSAECLDRRLRAFTPWPGAFTFVPGEIRPKLLKVHAAEPIAGPFGEPGKVVGDGRSGLVVACGTGALRLTEVQPEGGRRMTAEQFLAGHRLTRLD